MREQPLFGVVRGHVPRRAGCCVKVIVPMFVKGIACIGDLVDQPIVKHLWWSCTAIDCVQPPVLRCS